MFRKLGGMSICGHWRHPRDDRVLTSFGFRRDPSGAIPVVKLNETLQLLPKLLHRSSEPRAYGLRCVVLDGLHPFEASYVLLLCSRWVRQQSQGIRKLWLSQDRLRMCAVRVVLF